MAQRKGDAMTLLYFIGAGIIVFLLIAGTWVWSERIESRNDAWERWPTHDDQKERADGDVLD